MGASDSKLQFKSHINTLTDQRVLAKDHEFWKVLYTAALTETEVYEAIQPEDVRKLREQQPGNLATIIYKVCFTKNVAADCFNQHFFNFVECRAVVFIYATTKLSE